MNQAMEYLSPLLVLVSAVGIVKSLQDIKYQLGQMVTKMDGFKATLDDHETRIRGLEER